MSCAWAKEMHAGQWAGAGSCAGGDHAEAAGCLASARMGDEKPQPSLRQHHTRGNRAPSWVCLEGQLCRGSSDGGSVKMAPRSKEAVAQSLSVRRAELGHAASGPCRSAPPRHMVRADPGCIVGNPALALPAHVSHPLWPTLIRPSPELPPPLAPELRTAHDQRQSRAVGKRTLAAPTGRSAVK